MKKGVAKMNEIKTNLFLSLSPFCSLVFVELKERGGDPCYLGLTDAGGRPFVVALTGHSPYHLTWALRRLILLISVLLESVV